jgi:hypothetical protein
MSADEGSGADAGPDAKRAAGQGLHLDPASAERAAGLVRGWGNVPARDPDFAGREEQLAAARAGLLAGGPVVVHAVRGMGGAGKSQVAVEYAHRHAGDYALTWWLDCENTVLLGQQYAELAIHLGQVTRDAPPEEMRRAATSALRQHPSWLPPPTGHWARTTQIPGARPRTWPATCWRSGRRAGAPGSAGESRPGGEPGGDGTRPDRPERFRGERGWLLTSSLNTAVPPPRSRQARDGLLRCAGPPAGCGLA